MRELVTLNRSGHFAVGWATDLLQKAGLRVLPSFNLRAARAADTPCACSPNAKQCDCDMAVLLVYGVDPQPATLVTHSHNGRTWISLVDNPDVQLPAELGMQIKTALTASHIKRETAAKG